ncbi:MAG TPA: hypothetical protein VIJ52_06285 [Pseudolabrys sp.]
MNLILRSIALDPATDARLRELAAERGQDEAAVLAEAVALLDSVVDIGNPEPQFDRLLRIFQRWASAAHDCLAPVDFGTIKEFLPHRWRVVSINPCGDNRFFLPWHDSDVTWHR